MRPTARIALHTLGALFGALAVLFALGAWWLSSGPVSLEFLSPYVKEAFRDDDLDYRIEFNDTILVWAGWNRALEIQVTDVRIADTSGETIAQVPAAALGLSGAALLRGVIAPTSIELIGLSLGLVRDAEGQLALARGDDGGGADDAAADALVADLLDPPREDHPMGRLKRVSLRDAALTLHDEGSGLTWSAPDADITLDLDETAIVGHLSLDLRVQDVETRLDMQLFHHRASKMGSAAVEFAALNPAQLASVIPELEQFAGVRVPLSGSVSLDLAPDSVFSGAVFDIAGGAGEISMPEVFPQPVPVRRVAVAGSIDDTLSRLNLVSSVIETERPSFSLEGELWQADAGIGVRGHFRVRDMPFDSLGNYWPEGFIEAGRRWIGENVADGTITRFDAALDVAPGAFEHNRFDAASAAGTFAFEDASIHYLRPMPAVVGVDGSARFSGDLLELTMSGGRLEGIAASHGTATLSGIHDAQPRLSATIEAEGPVSDALALLNHPRLALMSKAGLELNQVGGRAHTLFTVNLPLLKTIAAEQISFHAVARVQDGRMEEIAGIADMTEGSLRLGIDNASMDLRGTARLQGMPATISWQERFGGEAPFARRLEVATTVTPEGQAALGLDLAPYVQGSLALDARYTDRGGDEPPHATLRLNAKAARFEIPDLYWSKPAGEPGTVSVDAELPPDGPVELTRVELTTETLYALGRATLDRELGGAREITIEALRHGLNDIAGRIEADADGTSISIRGASLDARPYLDGLMHESAPQAGQLVLDFDVERVLTADKRQLTNVRARFETDAEGRHAGFMEGTLETGVPLHFSLEPQEDARLITVRSHDAGTVARTFDIYDNAVGGDLLMEAVLHDDRPGTPVTGTVRIDDFRVINAPTLARLLSIATLTGMVDALQGEGIAFSRLELPFSVEGNVLTVQDARASGFAVGVNAEGTVDLETDEVDMSGTIVPAYSLNTLVDKIPVLGELLTGGKGEGLFAASYRVDGTTEEPDIAVNPLTVLTPGFLRGLFSFMEEGEAEPE